jgi:hypothetical protein
MPTLIDPALAQGIRRAYLESLNKTTKALYNRMLIDKMRHPRLHTRTYKLFKKDVTSFRAIIEISSKKSSGEPPTQDPEEDLNNLLN